MSIKPCVIVHGGAWAIPDSMTDACAVGCQRAARLAYQVLSDGGSALDACERAVNSLEDDPTFDAGFGSDLNAAGFVEMDAMIMNGQNLQCGSVAAIRSVRNPISVARKVMEKTNHVLLVGQGADAFAREQGFPEVATEDLISENAKQVLEQMKTYGNTVTSQFTSVADNDAAKSFDQQSHDTVGCVALDSFGNLAAATSTGGISAKRVGRVGDSPLVGSGGYADNQSGAVSVTGHGESIIKVNLARLALWLHEYKLAPSLQAAAEQALAIMRTRTQGCGGLIMIDTQGSIAHAFSTPRMCWASVDQNGQECVGIEK